ncbi:UPF0271 protein [Saonia flava]|uniref:UPF0271 protein n=1 Tax=Saonia flava TaxID=523696 RepID=A0A846QPS7_9FLAO|nr:5-oxoprolinase subunit PxpA [Saonia flava]NJB70081.1 UPF0271 protein [Saonia flava]
MGRIEIDINCDVGEGMGNEEKLFPFISSCNIACGGHAGDSNTMDEVVQLAIKNDIKIGAHPSYPDKANFGRISLNIPLLELQESIKKQINSLILVLKKNKAPLHHIKPHGALYNDIAMNLEMATVFLEAIEQYKEDVYLYVPYNSVIEELAKENGYKIKREAFGDRNYNADLGLVSRSLPNALITSPKDVMKHLLHMIKNQNIKTSDGEIVEIYADTYCIHGDTPNALKILMYLSVELSKLNIYIK